MTRVLVCYDVSDDATRRRVRSLCRRYGGWQQYSVFELELTRQQRSEFESACQSLVEDIDTGVEIRLVTIADDTTIGTRPGTDSSGSEDGTDDDDPANIV